MNRDNEEVEGPRVEFVHYGHGQIGRNMYSKHEADALFAKLDRQLLASLLRERELQEERDVLIEKNRKFALLNEEMSKLVDKACDAGEASESRVAVLEGLLREPVEFWASDDRGYVYAEKMAVWREHVARTLTPSSPLTEPKENSNAE